MCTISKWTTTYFLQPIVLDCGLNWTSRHLHAVIQITEPDYHVGLLHNIWQRSRNRHHVIWHLRRVKTGECWCWLCEYTVTYVCTLGIARLHIGLVSCIQKQNQSIISRFQGISTADMWPPWKQRFTQSSIEFLLAAVTWPNHSTYSKTGWETRIR